MKRILLLALTLLSLNFSQAQGISDVQRKVLAYDTLSILKHGQWSVYAEYTDNGEVIADLNSSESLAPASGLKVFTSSVALSILGADFRFKTELYYSGTINSGGLLTGDLYIKGGGDPTLGSSLVKGSPALDSLMTIWGQAVKALGIKKIEGSVIADDFLFDRIPVPDQWYWGDIGNYYGAGPSALSINDNLYHLFFKPAETPGKQAEVLRTEPEVEGLKFVNYMSTGAEGSGDNGYIYCAPGQFEATLRGTIPAGVKEFSIKGSIPDPPLFAARYFSNYLEKSGIAVAGIALKADTKPEYSQMRLFHTTLSPKLEDIVYIINKKSNNLYTEHLLRQIALKETGSGSSDNGIDVIEKFFRKNNLPYEGVHLYDGCGLSRSDAITARAMVGLLSFMTHQSVFAPFYYSLGIAGDPDDISYYKNYGRNTLIAKNARIKSGLINRVRSRSGYVRTKSGRMAAFSFICNNHEGTMKQIDDIHVDLMISIAQLEEAISKNR